MAYQCSEQQETLVISGNVSLAVGPDFNGPDEEVVSIRSDTERAAQATN